MAEPKFVFSGQDGCWTDRRVHRQESFRFLTFIMKLPVSALRRLVLKYLMPE